MEKQALKEAIKEASIELFKKIPGLSLLIEGARKYKEYAENEQKKELLILLEKRIIKLEKGFNEDLYNSNEAKIYLKKLISTALNPEYADKLEFFANMLINTKMDYSQMERLKYVEMVRQLSKPALVVLDAANRLYKPASSSEPPTSIVPNQIAEETGFNLTFINVLISELYELGVFNPYVVVPGKGIRNVSNREGIAAYTEYSERFSDFIKNPGEMLTGGGKEDV